MKIITGKVRANYPNIFTPVKLEEDQEAKYSITILIPKTDIQTLEAINTKIYKTKLQLFEKYNNIPDNIKSPLRDGDIEKPDNEAYRNHYFINTSSKFKPGIVDQKLNPITNPNEIYAGCYIRASLNLYPYYNNGMCGVGCGVNNIQKIADGEIINTKPRPEDDFSVINLEDTQI
ncbi:MAG: DUF2815 family protein [Peptostreptococcaceae bacterium]